MWIPIIAGISGLLQSQQAANAQHGINQTNIDQNRENRNWQEMMSNTAHQREVADLKAAGLNPNLSATGAGSSTPSGGTPSLAAPAIQFPELGGIITNVMKMQQDQQRIDQDSERIKISQFLASSQAAKSLTEQELNKAKKIMLGKGMIRAEVEGEGAAILRDIMQFVKDKFRGRKLQNSPFPPGFQPNPSGMNLDLDSIK